MSMKFRESQISNNFILKQNMYLREDFFVLFNFTKLNIVQMLCEQTSVCEYIHFGQKTCHVF